MKRIFLSVAALMLATYLNAQTPEGFNYQAVARDAQGTVIGKQNIALQISILGNDEVVYTETHQVETSELGLFSLSIGEGTIAFGDFATIDWSTGNYAVKIEMDAKGGWDYTLMGTTQLLAVPYAMHAKTAENVFSGDYNDLINKPSGDSIATLGADDPWVTGGNAGTTNGVDFIGTTDEEDLDFRVNDIIHFRMTENGQLEVLNTGGSVFIGQSAGRNDDLSNNKNVFIGGSTGQNNSTGQRNVASGYWAFYSNTTGSYNTVSGSYAMRKNTTGSSNSAYGNFSMYNNTTGGNNTAYGDYTLFKNTVGSNSVAVGTRALNANTTGTDNVAVGAKTLEENTTADNNTAIGSEALSTVEDQGNNTAVGALALQNNVNRDNTAVGSQSLNANDDGIGNTAMGSLAMLNNEGGNFNVAVGHRALEFMEEGDRNIAVGFAALLNSTDASHNVGIGSQALQNTNNGDYNIGIGTESLNVNTDGDFNIALGYETLNQNTTGGKNIALGSNAMFENTTGVGNVAIGINAMENSTTGGGNVAIGSNAGLNIDTHLNTIAIGNAALSGGSNTVRIGNASMTSIGGFQNWTNVSDGRFKTNVTENVGGLDFIMKLRPVTYNLNMDAIADFQDMPDSLRDLSAEQAKGSEVQVGFIAQEVEQAANESNFDFHGVEAPKDEDSHYGLRYAEFVPSLVKAVQEQQETIEAQKELIDELLNRLETLEQETKE